MSIIFRDPHQEIINRIGIRSGFAPLNAPLNVGASHPVRLCMRACVVVWLFCVCVCDCLRVIVCVCV